MRADTKFICRGPGSVPSPSIFQKRRKLEPKVVSLGLILFHCNFNLPPIFQTPDFSNQFSIPLEVLEIVIPLYCLNTTLMYNEPVG